MMENKRQKKEKITIDKLAKITKEGFVKLETNLRTEFDGRIDKLAQITARGFEQVDKRFDSLEVQIVEIKEDVRQIRNEIKQIWNKLDEIEQRLEQISKTSKEDADAIASDVLDLRRRVEFLENQIKEMQSA